MIKTPSWELLQYIRDRYTYNPDTGAISSKGRTIGSVRKDGMIVINVSYCQFIDGARLSCTVYAHQIAWYLTCSIWPDKFIDHIDGDRSNNRLSNLRLATPSQNSHNMKKGNKITSSKYKGVVLDNGKWKAYITHNGKKHTIGRYPTEGEAAAAYDTKAVEVFGAYAKCNFGENRAISDDMKQLDLPWG